MKRPFLFLILTLFFISGFAPSDFAQNGKKEKTHALDFYLINGVSFAYQQKMSAKSSWRFYVSLSGNAFSLSGSDKMHSYYPSDTSFSKADDSNKRNSQSIAISPQYFYQIKQWGKVRLSLGVGPIFTFRRYHSNYDQNFTNQNKNTRYYSKSHTQEYSAGASLLSKLDVLIMENIALFTQCDLNTVYTNSYDTDTSKSLFSKGNLQYDRVEKKTWKGWQMGINTLRVGLSIFF